MPMLQRSPVCPGDGTAEAFLQVDGRLVA